MMHVLKEGDPITIKYRTTTGVIESTGEFADLVYADDGRVWLQYYLSTQREAATDLLPLEHVIAVQLRSTP